MKLARAIVSTGGEPTVGVLYKQAFFPVQKGFVETIQSWKTITEEIEDSHASGKGMKYGIDEVRLLAPFAGKGSTIFCVGKNYLEHVGEVDSAGPLKTISKPAAPKHPIIFPKSWSTVIGNGEAVQYPVGISEELDYEGELAVVIGKKGRNLSLEEAYDHVFGFSIVNDITARDLQRKHQQWFLGKSLDTFCPMGPVVVPKEQLLSPDKSLNLNLKTYVNGELRQSGNTKDLLFSIPTLISTISKGITLRPGDVLATGTPSGVGAGFKPPKFLRQGDTITIKIDGIGELENVVQLPSDL